MLSLSGWNTILFLMEDPFNWLIHWLSESLILCENILTAAPCANGWRWCFPLGSLSEARYFCLQFLVEGLTFKHLTFFLLLHIWVCCSLPTFVNLSKGQTSSCTRFHLHVTWNLFVVPRSYYLHTLRDSLFPVYDIFSFADFIHDSFKVWVLSMD